MTNGHDAEVTVILSGGQDEVNKYLVETVMEIKGKQYVLQKTCEERGRYCPGLEHSEHVTALARLFSRDIIIPILVAVMAAVIVRLA
jgi:hypothetical protein